MFCLWCGNPLPEDAPLSQRYHKGKCANEKGIQLRRGRYGHSDPIPKEKSIKLCKWCNKPLSKNSPSAKKYHDGKCKILGYREQNARAVRAFRFRREMGIAMRR